MPYSSMEQLPDPVRDNLPAQAQRIFIDAFNSAYAKLRPEESEVSAFKVAWNAVKDAYEKKNGKWRRKPP